jgi:hypothetical protein
MSGPSSSRVIGAAAAVGVAVLLTYHGLPAQEPPLEIPRERVLAVDMRIEDTTSFAAAATTGAAGRVWQHDVRSAHPGAGSPDAVRVKLQIEPPSDGPWSIRVSDDRGNEIERITPATLPTGGGSIWTEEVPGPLARVELWREASGRAPAVRIERYAYRIVPTVPQAIHGKDQRLGIQQAPFRIRRFAPPVARLRFPVGDQAWASCTGFLVGRRLMMTNEHCIASQPEAASAFVDFNYDGAGMKPVTLRGSTLVAVSAPLDFAVVRLAADPPAAAGRLFFGPTPQKDPQPLFIIQHPSGLPKQVSIADCATNGLSRVGAGTGDRSDFGHTCDTLGGSSGSPVLDWNTGRVVGLHHFGFLPGAVDPVNQAVHVQRILDSVKAQDAAAHTEITKTP